MITFLLTLPVHNETSNSCCYQSPQILEAGKGTLAFCLHEATEGKGVPQTRYY